MLIAGLLPENVNEYKSFLTEDAAEFIGREFVRGFVLIPDEGTEPVAGIIYALSSGEGISDIVSKILFLKAEDEESADILLDEYTRTVTYMECTSSVFNLAGVGKVEKQALEKAGFTMETKEGSVITLALADFGMALLGAKDKRDESIRPLSEADDRAFDDIIAEFELSDITGACEDLPYLPREFYDSDISCYAEDEGDIVAVALFHKRPSGKIELDLIAGSEENEVELKELLKQSAILAEEIYAPNTKFYLDRSDSIVADLVKDLFPKAKGHQILSGSRKEEPMGVLSYKEDPDDIEFQDEREDEDELLIADLYELE